MAQRNRWISLAAAAALAFGSASVSSVALAHAAATEGASSEAGGGDQTPAYEPVDSFVIFTRPSITGPATSKHALSTGIFTFCRNSVTSACRLG